MQIIEKSKETAGVSYWLDENMTDSSIHNSQLSIHNSFRTDHLGNITATYTDLKLANFGMGDDPRQPFSLDLRSVSSYYPFGMLQPYRHWTAPLYKHRFGYNGMEKDDEVKGLGNSYTTLFRGYDPRLGRWFSLDPKPTASESWYAGMGNNPIINTDVLGDIFMDHKAAHINFLGIKHKVSQF